MGEGTEWTNYAFIYREGLNLYYTEHFTRGVRKNKTREQMAIL